VLSRARNRSPSRRAGYMDDPDTLKDRNLKPFILRYSGEDRIRVSQKRR
jgi:hypothetical protein